MLVYIAVAVTASLFTLIVSYAVRRRSAKCLEAKRQEEQRIRALPLRQRPIHYRLEALGFELKQQAHYYSDGMEWRRCSCGRRRYKISGRWDSPHPGVVGEFCLSCGVGERGGSLIQLLERWEENRLYRQSPYRALGEGADKELLDSIKSRPLLNF